MDLQLTAEQRTIQEAARALGEELASRGWDEEESRFEYLRQMARQGMAGVALPAEDGGQGFTLFESVLVIEAITRVNPHAGDMVQATNFGAIRQVAALGSGEVKDRFLRPAHAGDALLSVAITEPEAGSSVTDMKTTARLDGDEVVVNGSKIFNTNGPWATHFVVWARFGEGRGSESIGAVVVPADAPGFSRGKTEHYLGGEPHCALYFDDCRVPAANVLADSGGLKRLLPIFNIERLGNASRSLASGERAFELAVAHAAERRQFGRPLAEFQGLQWKFADMRVKLDAARLLLYRAANAPGGVPDAMTSSIAKLACNTAGYEVANEAVQVFGGLGLSTEYPLGYLLARTRGWMIAGGSLEMLRNRIAEGIFDRSFSQRPASRS